MENADDNHFIADKAVIKPNTEMCRQSLDGHLYERSREEVGSHRYGGTMR